MSMDKILRDLYCCNFEAFERSGKSCPEYSKALSKVTRLEDDLKERIPKEWVPLFMEYVNACAALNCVSGEEDFIWGFRMGTRFTLAAFHDVFQTK